MSEDDDGEPYESEQLACIPMEEMVKLPNWMPEINKTNEDWKRHEKMKRRVLTEQRAELNTKHDFASWEEVELKRGLPYEPPLEKYDNKVYKDTRRAKSAPNQPIVYEISATISKDACRKIRQNPPEELADSTPYEKM